jgi:hypothetical protein
VAQTPTFAFWAALPRGGPIFPRQTPAWTFLGPALPGGIASHGLTTIRRIAGRRSSRPAPACELPTLADGLDAPYRAAHSSFGDKAAVTISLQLQIKQDFDHRLAGGGPAPRTGLMPLGKRRQVKHVSNTRPIGPDSRTDTGRR